MRFFLLVALLLVGCEPEVPDTDTAAPVLSTATSSEAMNVVEVVTRGMAFDAPDEVPSGWTTVRLKNEGEVTHFALFNKMPEGYGIEDQLAEVAPVFVEGAELLYAGEMEAAMEVFGKLPEWSQRAVYVGGPGLLAPGNTAEVTMNLAPGTYVLECYVKTNGAFHPMAHEITVTDAGSSGSAPTPTLEMTISSTGGIEAEDDVPAGTHTVALHFADQVVHEHFLGHDVHLARIDDDTDLDALAGWMNWAVKEGLNTPPPAEFLGGTHEMPAGETAYFTVTLEPGQRYAWVAEVPDPAAKGMLKTFTVSQPSDPSDS